MKTYLVATTNESDRRRFTDEAKAREYHDKLLDGPASAVLFQPEETLFLVYVGPTADGRPMLCEGGVYSTAAPSRDLLPPRPTSEQPDGASGAEYPPEWRAYFDALDALPEYIGHDLDKAREDCREDNERSRRHYDRDVYELRDNLDGVGIDHEVWSSLTDWQIDLLPDAIFPVTLREFKTPAGRGTCAGAVVLRVFESSRAHRYVTHWRNDDLGGFNWGHYFDNFNEAEEDYCTRVRRGF